MNLYKQCIYYNREKAKIFFIPLCIRRVIQERVGITWKYTTLIPNQFTL